MAGNTIGRASNSTRYLWVYLTGLILGVLLPVALDPSRTKFTLPSVYSYSMSQAHMSDRVNTTDLPRQEIRIHQNNSIQISFKKVRELDVREKPRPPVNDAHKHNGNYRF